jgi:hypothetical protein
MRLLKLRTGIALYLCVFCSFSSRLKIQHGASA